MIFLHNCTQLQRCPFLLFRMVWDLPGNGSSAMFLFFHEVSVFREHRIVSDGVWAALKPHRPLLIHTYAGGKTSRDDVWRLPPQTLFNCSSPQCLRLRGATQTECCNISYHGNKLFWGGVFGLVWVSRALDEASRSRFGFSGHGTIFKH